MISRGVPVTRVRTLSILVVCLALIAAPVAGAVGDPGGSVAPLVADDTAVATDFDTPLRTFFDGFADWPTFLGNHTRSGNVPGASGPKTNISVLWNATDDSFSAPVVANGTVYAVNGSAMKAFDADTGVQQWEWVVPDLTTYDGGLDRDAAPVVVGDRVFALTNGYLLGFNTSTGTLEVSYAADYPLSDASGIAAVGDTLYFAFEYDNYRASDINGRVYAVGTDGVTRWTRNLTNWVDDGDYVTATADTVFVRNIWNYTAFDAATGAVRWNRSFAEYLRPAAAANGLLYFAAVDDYTATDPNDYVYAVHEQNGTTAWRFNVSQAVGSDYALPNALSTDGSTVYFFDKDGTLYAVDALTGAVQYTHAHDIVDPTRSVVANGLLYSSGAEDGVVRAFDAATGDSVWNLSVPYSTSYGEPSAPAIDNGTLYVGTIDGVLAVGEGVHYSNLVVSDTTPNINDTVTVSVDVSNPQSVSRDYTAELRVDDTVWDTTTGTLASGASTTVTFTTTFSYPTNYTLTAGNHPTQAAFSPVTVSVQPQPTGTWRAYRGDANGTGATDASGPTGNLSLLWSAPFSSEPNSLVSPVVADGLVFAGTDDDFHNYYGNLSAYDAATGETVWYRVGLEPRSTGAVANGTLYVAADYDDTALRFYAIDTATGDIDWQTSLSTYPRYGASPVVAGDTVYLGVDDGTVYAFNTTDGSVRWTTALPDYVQSTPAVSGDTVYVGDYDGHLYALDTADGSERWNLSVDSYGASSPAIDGGTLYVAHDDLVAVDLATHTVDWRTTLPSGVDDSDPAVRDGVVYVGNTDGTLSALSAATGDFLWNASADTGDLGPPVVADGAVYVVDDYDGLYVFDVTDGTRLAYYDTYAPSGVPAVVDGYVYLWGEIDYDYSLVALRGTTGTTPMGTLSVTGTTDFGSVDVGNSTSGTLTVENTGTADVAVTGTTVVGTDSGGFSVTAGGAPFDLAPGATRAVTVTFAPTHAGTNTATFRVASNATPPTTDVSVSGTGLDAALTPSPSSLDFGPVEVNTTDTDTVSFAASGGLPVTVTSIDITGADADKFSVTAGAPTTLNSGNSLDVTVSVAPTAFGLLSATLNVTTDDADIGTVGVPLSANGTAVARPDVTLSASSLAFGSVRTDRTDTRTLTVTNDGDATLTVSGVSITGSSAFSAPTGGFTLAPDASRNLTVTFAPSSTGAASGTLTVASDDPDQSTVSVALSGTGTRPPSSHSGSPGSSPPARPAVSVMHDGSNTSISVTNAGGTVSVDVGFGGANVSVDRLSLNGTSGDYSFSVSPTADDGTLAGAVRFSLLHVDHSFSNADIEDVTFEFTVSKARLAAEGVSPDHVVLYRRPDGASTWTALPTVVVGETSDAVTFRAVSPGFSTFAVAGDRASFSVSASAPDTATVGDDVAVAVTVANDGRAEGVFDIRVTAGGATVDTDSVALESGEARTLTVSVSADAAGDLPVAVNGETVATISVRSADTDGTSTTPGTTTVDESTTDVATTEGPTTAGTTTSAGTSEGAAAGGTADGATTTGETPGFGPVVALLALLVTLALLGRRDRT